LVGAETGGAITTGYENTFVGRNAGAAITDSYNNTFIGRNAGSAITSGVGNTIIGKFNGNQNGLDIRTANHYIVISDGTATPRLWWDGSAWNGISSGGTAFSAF